MHSSIKVYLFRPGSCTFLNTLVFGCFYLVSGQVVWLLCGKGRGNGACFMKDSPVTELTRFFVFLTVKPGHCTPQQGVFITFLYSNYKLTTIITDFNRLVFNV